LRSPSAGNRPAIAGLAPAGAGARGAASNPERPLGFSPNQLQGLLCVSGIACCVAMSMPQVHMVAYCADVGFPAARGAEMLALRMGRHRQPPRLGLDRRRIGGLRTAAAGRRAPGNRARTVSAFDGLAALYVVSALFGLFQGGIVPPTPSSCASTSPRAKRARARHRDHGDARRHGDGRLDARMIFDMTAPTRGVRSTASLGAW